MPMDPRLYQELLVAVDTRVKQHLEAQPRSAYGVVASVDMSTRKASVYLSGSTVASTGFNFGAATAPAVGELVRVVIDPRGDRYIDSPMALSDSLIAAGTAWSGWPLGGGRQTVVSGGLANGYPADTGLLISWNINEYRGVQHFYEPARSGDTGRAWYRTRHTSSISKPGNWGDWKALTSHGQGTGWTGFTYQNGWSDYSTAFQPGSYMKDSEGFVHLKGLVKGGTAPVVVITNLPAGFRPLKTVLFGNISSGNIMGRVDVSSSGNVTIQAGSTAWFSLEGLTFMAEA